MKEDRKEDFFTRLTNGIWRFFSSVTLTVTLLILLALASIPGTIIEQGSEEKNLLLMAKIFGPDNAYQALEWLIKLGFLDAYHSWWFILLLILLTSNLTICTLDRFPKTWKLMHLPQTPLNDAILASVSSKAEIRIKGNMEKTKEKVSRALKDHGYNLSEKRIENALHLYSQKGKYSRLGVYITHLSIILIFIGAIIGGAFGFKGYINLPEGKMSDAILLKDQRTVKPLGFFIRCDRFNVDYYGTSDMPKDYVSELTIIKDGKEVLRKSIEVNDPLTFEGITFYQSSYGLIPDAEGRILLSVQAKGDPQIKELNLGVGDSFRIPGTDMGVRILQFNHAFAMDKSGRVFTYSEQMVNPAIEIEVLRGNTPLYRGWILKRHPETGILPEGHVIKFHTYWGAQYTGLQVAKDPGIGIVYFACGLMSLGLIIAFFTYHKKVWARLVEEKGHVIVTLAGTVNKNRIAFEREFERMVKSVTEA